MLGAWTLTLGTTSAGAEAFSIGDDGKTEPIHTYADAIRQRVMIPQPGIDQDGDGEDDKIAVDIIRPAGSGTDMQVPAIIMPSPYFTTSCRGLESECMADKDNDGVNDIWPMFYDNYFLPRGYAYILAQANGTGHSTGCPLHGGPRDVQGMRSVIDWLNGRANGETAGGAPVLAGWHNGSSAMIGKSYDGTFANGVAATGVEGLKTIVPITAISAWYNYSRTGGVRHNTNYPSFLSGVITNPSRVALCSSTRSWLNTVDGDETGDYNDFWQERNHNKDVANVKASVFAVQGFQDDNVKMDHLSMWWRGLTAHDVPRKLWLLRSGHTDPFDARRAEWVDTLHRWFDHYLLDIDNGIVDEPKVTIEDEKDVWVEYEDWPIPGTKDVDLYLRGAAADEPGTLGGGPGGGETDTQTYVDTTISETTYMNTPEVARSGRLVFLSPPLTKTVRLSGDATLKLRAALDKPQSNLSAILVDYGPATQVDREFNGTQITSSQTCWGDPGTYDRDCFHEVSKRTENVTQWRVTRGIIDSSNRDSLWTEESVTPGEFYTFELPLMTTEHIFEVGHRIGIVLGTRLYGILETAGTGVTVDTRQTHMSLPLLGGYPAAVEAGITDPDTAAPTLEGMPDDIELDLSDPAGEFIDYELPTAVDNEDPEPTVSCDPEPGSLFTFGTTTVSCEARDVSGNVGQASFTVTLTDPNQPEPEPEPEPGPGDEDDPKGGTDQPVAPGATPSVPAATPPQTKARSNRQPRAQLSARKLRTKSLGALRSRTAPQRYRLDARRSSDPDGRIVSYRWTSAGRTFSRTAVAELTVTRPTRVTLVIEDNRGARARRSTTLQPRRRLSTTVTRTITYCNGCARPRGTQLRSLLGLRTLLDRTARVAIDGHTAGPGPESENRAFAERRARLAARILFKGHATPPPLKLRSFGDNRPVADNRDEAGQAKNRRVEVRLTLLRD